MNRNSYLKSVEMNWNSHLKSVEIYWNYRLKTCWNKLNFVEDISTNINIIEIAGRHSSCWFCRPACSCLPVRWNWRLGFRQQEVYVVAAGLEKIPGAAAARNAERNSRHSVSTQKCRDWVGAQPLPLCNSTGRSTGTSFGRGERYVLRWLSQEV